MDNSVFRNLLNETTFTENQIILSNESISFSTSGECLMISIDESQVIEGDKCIQDTFFTFREMHLPSIPNWNYISTLYGNAHFV